MTTLTIPCTLPCVRRQNTNAGTFSGVMAALFAVSAAVTIAWCGPMTGGMPMPGGWAMSMVWMRMPGQTWIEATASFLAMWVVMMAAMMLPSLTPMLWRYRQAAGWRGESRLGRLTLVAGLGYFFVWAVCGAGVFALGAALAAVEMQQPALARAVPAAAGAIVLIAGAVQLTSWKAHYLACCRESSGGSSAWRLGVSFGVQCGLSCANLMAILLVMGVMDLRAMAVVTAAITSERLAPAGERIARGIGVVAIVAGLLLIHSY